jgi:hypothetical protein
MRILFAIPHYFRPTADGPVYGSLRSAPAARTASVAACLTAIQQSFGRPQCVIDIARRTTLPANHATANGADVVVCTTGNHHLLDRLPPENHCYSKQATDAEPMRLGFECHRVLRDRMSEGYDYFCYLEDDLVIRDPWFFEKLRWFTDRFGDDTLLMPNRYEVLPGQIVHKAYVDGPLKPEATRAFQNIAVEPILETEFLGKRIRFERATNPHSGGFFLNRRQMEFWATTPGFGEGDSRFVGPLESAATLGVMQTFRISKPAAANAAFLEVEHHQPAFLPLIRMPTPQEAKARGIRLE